MGEQVSVRFYAELFFRVEYLIISLSAEACLYKAGVPEAVPEVEAFPAYADVHIVAPLVQALDEKDDIFTLKLRPDGFKDGGTVSPVAPGSVHGEV